jgi:hypothetical protein
MVSGRNTADGDNVLLDTDSVNNNILVGRAKGPTGHIVFAAYIQESGPIRLLTHS